MTSIFIEFIGIFGGFITTSSIIPQIIKCYRTKSTRDLSWQMFIIYYMGTMITFSYGIAIYHPAIYIPCIYSMTMNAMIMYMKWHFERENNHTSQINKSLAIQESIPLQETALNSIS
jgi:MtN3 and saliva related transmembrane protein